MPEQERLYRQRVEGSQATMVLQVLEEFFNDTERSIMARSVLSDSPQQAYQIACELKAMRALIGEMKARISIGDRALEEIIKMEG